jgi:NADH dehydrogenase/NADH:ubiquinone oxidoreductase subunit G
LYDTIDLNDSLGSEVTVAIKESEIVRITPKKNIYSKNIFISNTARFSFDAASNLRLTSSYIKQNEE